MTHRLIGIRSFAALDSRGTEEQYKFDFFGTGELPPCDLKAARDYASDVEAVASECGNVKTRLALANDT